MHTPVVTRVFLLGLPGSGKTTSGRLVAAMLGWEFVDTDALVEQMAGRSVPQIFKDEGEGRFRELESRALDAAIQRERVVIGTGGGIVGSAAHRERMRAHGWRVTLHVSPSEAALRLTAEQPASGSEAHARPLLAGDDPLGRLHELEQRRRAYYDEADDAVATDGLTPHMVAARVVAGLVARGLVPGDGAKAEARVRCVRAGPGGAEAYDSVVEWGGLARLGERLAALQLPARLHVVADANVGALYGALVLEGLRASGFEPLLFEVPAGESSKSRPQLNALHDWLAERRAERREAVVALGGGVVGDLAGFAAATYLRGVPLVQVPMTLLAQVDASIGGKVGIDHPRGKNLLGAFHQPRLVLADPAVLQTLPPRVRTEGWAEVVKHGVALDAGYFERLEREAVALEAQAPAPLTAAIAGSVALKADIVEADERERDDGSRLILNYGHTIGHALEAVGGYHTWLHGEAVAVGMAAAARVGLRLGVTPPEVVTRQDALLAAFGLPVRADGVAAAALMRAALWDKKVRGGRVRWVLLTALGRATVVSDVPDAVVHAALLDIGANAEAAPTEGE